MWPSIIRENGNGKGIKLDEAHWINWGPSDMFYYNPDLFDDTKKIGSIYCMYLPQSEIKFNPDEIAMGIIYECGDFGQHTVLFSYSECPDLKYNSNWDFCIFSDYSSDMESSIELKEALMKRKNGIIKEDEVYQVFLENQVLLGFVPIETFRKKLNDIIKEYQKIKPGVSEEEAYIKLLEKLSDKSNSLDPETRFELIKRIRESCDESDNLEFNKLMLEYISVPTAEGIEDVQEKYNRNLSYVQNQEENDLDSMFRNCRDYFLDKAIRYEKKEIDDMDFDPKTFKLIKTGKKRIVHESRPGRIIKGKDGKAKFEVLQRKIPKIPEDMRDFLENDELFSLE